MAAYSKSGQTQDCYAFVLKACDEIVKYCEMILACAVILLMWVLNLRLGDESKIFNRSCALERMIV